MKNAERRMKNVEKGTLLLSTFFILRSAFFIRF